MQRDPSKEGPANKLLGLPKTRVASLSWQQDIICNAYFQPFPTDGRGSVSCSCE